MLVYMLYAFMFCLQIYCIGNPNTDEEVNYYSMMNAPLISIQNFDTAGEFLKVYDERLNKNRIRPIVAVELSSNSVNLWSAQAMEVLKHDQCLLVLGDTVLIVLQQKRKTRDHPLIFV